MLAPQLRHLSTSWLRQTRSLTTRRPPARPQKPTATLARVHGRQHPAGSGYTIFEASNFLARHKAVLEVRKYALAQILELLRRVVHKPGDWLLIAVRKLRRQVSEFRHRPSVCLEVPYIYSLTGTNASLSLSLCKVQSVRCSS